MTTDTKDKIIAYIRYHGQARAQDLFETLNISRVAVHKQLKNLLKKGTLIRVGRPPVVFYTFPAAVVVTKTSEIGTLPPNTQQIIDANFLAITPDGNLLYGAIGFVYWARINQKNRPITTIAEEYVESILEQKKLYAGKGWIDATPKLTETFHETPITHLFFEDVYSYKTYGRTRLAKLVMYAKQIGDKNLIDQISYAAKPIIEAIVKKYNIEAVAFIPPTIPRPLQFMDEFERWLRLQLPKIELAKVVPGDIPIPQKTLTSLNERVINAKNTIFVKSNKVPQYENILLIDDVAGSGASLNETAKKLKKSNIGYGEIIAFGLVGNIKGYDVIREI